MADVLVVDDMNTDRELAGRVVTKVGHRTVYATNGAEAFEIARTVKPSLILLDVVMPGTNGYTLCRQLKTEPATANIPIVLVTSKAQASDVFWGKKQGAAAVLAKPYTPDALEKLVREHLR